MSWIKMRTNLRTDGRVRRVARLCDISKAECIGHLFVFWSLADEHSTDGVLKNWDKESVDDETCPGFFNALAEVEWADTTPDGEVVVPRFSDHNGRSAKTRAQGASRAAKYRARAEAVMESAAPEKPSEPPQEDSGGKIGWYAKLDAMGLDKMQSIQLVKRVFDDHGEQGEQWLTKVTETCKTKRSPIAYLKKIIRNEYGL
ncbi:MAG: hypothetical protein CMK81_00780 [Pseudomonadales bacterium]|nr:hypothetical protein [Pseudomonadales bacterium]|tara:strand:- start:8065 stop:8667 length:603 start_codon:yes stop_codon:yes gene_type:complete